MPFAVRFAEGATRTFQRLPTPVQAALHKRLVELADLAENAPPSQSWSSLSGNLHFEEAGYAVGYRIDVRARALIVDSIDPLPRSSGPRIVRPT